MEQALADEREFLLKSLRDLELEHMNGDLSDDEYRHLRDDYTARAANVLHSLQVPGSASVTQAPQAEVSSSAKRRPSRRAMGWLAGVVILATGAGFFLTSASENRLAGDPATGSIVGGSANQLERAAILAADGKVLEAIKLYDAVLADDPEQIQALAYKGWLLKLAGLPMEALASIDKAIAVDPTYPDAHFFRGMVLWQDQGNAAGAVQEFRLFLANNPPQEMVPLVEGALERAMAEAQSISPSP